MGLEFCSLASGSSGNCYLIRSDNTLLLVDAGITGKRIILGMEELGLDPVDIDGILLTHEHIDHVRSIRMMGRIAENATVYGTQGTFAGVEGKLPEDRSEVIPDRDFTLGDITVRAFDISHDAIEPTGYSFTCDDRKLTIVTDTGCITGDIFEEMYDSDLLVLEANHEENILKMGDYPYPLKQRILGEKGHLSNDAAARAICSMLRRREEVDIGASRAEADNERENAERTADEEGRSSLVAAEPPKVILAHLSRENNTPQQAFLTINSILFENDYFDGEHYHLSVLRRDQISPMIKV